MILIKNNPKQKMDQLITEEGIPVRTIYVPDLSINVSFQNFYCRNIESYCVATTNSITLLVFDQDSYELQRNR